LPDNFQSNQIQSNQVQSNQNESNFQSNFQSNQIQSNQNESNFQSNQDFQSNQNAKLLKENKNNFSAPDMVPVVTTANGKEQAGPLASCLPKIPDLQPQYSIPEKYEQEVDLKLQLCREILDIIEKAKNKGQGRVQCWEDIGIMYNSGNLVPGLFKIKGKKSIRSLRRWMRAYKKSDKAYSLTPKYSSNRERCVTEKEKNQLLNILLAPQRKSIGSAIRQLKMLEYHGTIKSPSSEPTLRRWVEDWKQKNYGTWVLCREGTKAWDETIMKTILRDDSLLKVGDVWVADGHVLALDTIIPGSNPQKVKRMTMIMFLDWASRYPVGASLAFSENAQHIKLALRNGIMNAGYAPLHVYIDNGKGFKAKLFTAPEKHDLKKSLSGIFVRLGIEPTFANAYNAKAKIIERFFRTFQEDFERSMDTFRGSKVEDKPAYLKRNEKWIKKMFQGEPLTVQETMSYISLYVSEMYGILPHRGLKGKKPKEVFLEGKKQIAEERFIAPAELNYLMLNAGIRKITNQGININGLYYWDVETARRVGQNVHVRWDSADVRYIMVLEEKTNRFICQAKLREKQHPFVKIAMDKPIAEAKLQKEIKEIKGLFKQQKKIATEVAKTVSEAVGNSKYSIQIEKEGEIFDESNMLPIVKIRKKGFNRKTKTKLDDMHEVSIKEKEKEKEKHKRSARLIEIEKRHGINYTYIPPELRNPKK